MKLTDKRFWTVLAIAEILLLASSIDVAVRCHSLGMIYVFIIIQPLMIVLAFFKRTHPNAALVKFDNHQFIYSLFNLSEIDA